MINMQAGIALHVRDRHPEQAEVALETIRQTSKDSLEQLRRTLAVFREPEDGAAPRQPAPGLAQLPSLVRTMEDSGLPVELEVSGAPGLVPVAVDLAAYRIVQESLTNVLRHADATSAWVRVAYAPRHVEVEVVNPGGGHPQGPSRSPGHGVAGMRGQSIENPASGERIRGPRTLVARSRKCVAVPPGTIHGFANAGEGVAHVLVEVRPAPRRRLAA